MIDEARMLPVSGDELIDEELMAYCVCSYYVSLSGKSYRGPAIDCPVHEDVEYWQARPIK